MRTFFNRARLVACCMAAVLGILNAPHVLAETIAVIGTGSVGGALGPEFAALGHTVVYGSRNPDSESVRDLVARTAGASSATTQQAAAERGDIVILAVPGLVVAEVLNNLGDLSGKIIIDPTNPLVRDDDGVFSLDVTTSNAEIIQALAPEADVVKAFSTINWTTMVDPGDAGGPVSVPLAGNSAVAKGRVAELVQALGLEPIDVGPVEHARHVEGMLILWINNRFGAGGPAFEFHLREQGAQ